MAGTAQASRAIQWDPEPVVAPAPDASKAIQWDAPTPNVAFPPQQAEPPLPLARPDLPGTAPASPVQTILPLAAPTAAAPPARPSAPPALALPRGRFSGPALDKAAAPPDGQAWKMLDTLGLRDLWIGHQGEAASVYHAIANIGRMIAGSSGTDEGVKRWTAFADDFDRLSAATVPGQVEPPAGLMAKINRGLGAAPLMVAEFMLSGRVLGPTLGFALPGAAKEADKGPAAAAKAALEGYFLGRVSHVAAPLTPLPRIAVMAGAGGADAAAHGGDVSDVVAGATTFGVLGVPGGPGQVGVGDVPGLAREGLRDMASPVAALRARLAPPPAAPRVEPTLAVPPLPRGGEPIVQPPGSGIVPPQSATPPQPPPVDANLQAPPEAAPPPVARPPAAPGPPIGGPQEGAPQPSPPAAGAPAVSGDVTPPVAPTEPRVQIKIRPPKTPIDGWNAVVIVDGKRFPVPPKIVGDGTGAGVAVAHETRAEMETAARRFLAQMRADGRAPSAEEAPMPKAPAAPVAPTTIGDRIAAGEQGVTILPRERQTVTTPTGRKIDTEYRVVEADSLATSHGDDFKVNPAYPAELQPRDRTRAASQAQVASIAGNLEPSLLGRSASASDGAPITGPDGVVESGNGRVMALRQVYDKGGGPAAAYRRFLESQGFSTEGLKRPVLVRQRVTDLAPADRAAFAREANARTTLSMSATEQAAADAKAGPDLFGGETAPASPEDILDRAAKPKEGGDLFSARRVVMDEAPAEGRRVVMDGELSAEGTVAATQAMKPGANYVGMVRDQVHAAVARRGGVPFRRESILADLAKGLGKPIFFGRVKGRGVLGFYRPRQGEVRIKSKGDIETVAHEIAHYLDDNIPEIRRQWHPASKANARVRAELAGVSYDKTKLYEGFAEFVRLWATQPHEAAARAPIFNGWFEDFVTRDPRGAVLRQMQVQMSDWFAQNAIDRAASKIGEGADIIGFLHNLRHTFRQAVADDLAGVLQMENAITGEKSTVARGAYETARLTRAAAAMVEGSLKYGRLVVRPDGSHGYEGLSLFDILDPVTDNLDDALRYFVGRSAAETYAQGRERLFTKAEIQGLLSLATPERQQAWEHFKEWQAGALDFAQRKGAIDPARRAKWRRMEYLPFFRVQAGGGSARSKGAPGDWHGIKALKGGTGNLRDVLSNVLRNQHMLIEAGLLNEARQKVFKLMSAPGGGSFMAPIGKDSKAVQVMVDQLRQAVAKDLGVSSHDPIMADFDAVFQNVSPMLTLFQNGMSPSGNGVVAALFRGEARFAEIIDPVLMRAMTAMQREPVSHPILKILNATRRIGQSSVTLALDFMAANWARDQIMAGIFSRAGYKPVISGAKGLLSRMRSDPAYRDYIANGGGIASNMRDEASVRRHIGRYYTNRGVNWRNVLETPGRILDALETIAESFEAATRIEEYKRSVAAGEHPRRAAYLSREVSTDWAMRGDSKALGALYDSVLFLKASVVSLDRIYRGFTRDPNKGRVMAITAAIAAFSALNYLNNRHRKDYQTMTDAERDIYWHFYVPGTDLLQHWSDTGQPLPPGPHGEEQGWHHFKFPKVWEVGAFASIAERQLEGILEGRPLEAQQHMARVIYQLFSINPIPQIFRPALEAIINRDMFTGGTVVPRGLEDVEPYAQASPSTSTVLRKAGRLESGLPSSLQLSPAQAEHLLRGYLNSWADYGLRLIDGLAFDDAPRMRLDQAPVVRRFYGEQPRLSSRYVEELYDMVGKADEVRATARLMMRSFSPDQTAVELRKPEVEHGIALKGAGKVLGGYRRQLDMVLRAPTLDDLHKILDFQARIAPTDQEIAAIRASSAYNSLPRLKTVMRDRLIAMRNQYAEREVKQLGGH